MVNKHGKTCELRFLNRSESVLGYARRKLVEYIIWLTAWKEKAISTVLLKPITNRRWILLCRKGPRPASNTKMSAVHSFRVKLTGHLPISGRKHKSP